MTRAGLARGEIGNVTFEMRKSGAVLAKVRFRKEDGTLDRIARTAANKTAAKRAVMTAAAERMQDVSDPSLGLTKDSTVADLTLAYLAVQVERNEGNTPQYLNDEGYIARRFVIDASFGATTLRGLRASIIAAEYRRLKDVLGLTGRARQWYTLVRKLAAYAVELDLLTVNPTNQLRLKRPRTTKKRAVASVEVAALRGVVAAYLDGKRPGPKMQPLLLDAIDVIIGSGLRIGEVLALRWAEDVKIEGDVPVLYVRGTVVEGHGLKKFRQEYPKSDKSERGIPIPDFLVETLSRRKAASHGQHRLVFETSTGRPVGMHQIRVQLRVVRDWAEGQPELPHISEDMAMHALRRGVATRVAADHDIVVAARILGNAESAVTEKHYVEKSLLAPDVRASLQAYGRPDSDVEDYAVDSD